MKAIEIENIYKTYPGKKGTLVNALKGVSFSVERGEVFGFLGPNGAGKSTTINILMGLLHASSGNAKIMGQNVTSHTARKSVGYLPENPSFYDYLTGREYLVFAARTFDMPAGQIDRKAEEVLRQLNLWDARNRPIRGYSKGMVQRLGLGQALIHDPEVYIFDEPMSGLDPVGRALVKEIILDLKAKGKCIFFSTHITADVELVCDRVGILVSGELQRIAHVGSVLAEGIVGYHVRVQERGGAVLKELDLAKDELPQFILAAQASDSQISSIEPRRKNLEGFFLDIVRGKEC